MLLVKVWRRTWKWRAWILSNVMLARLHAVAAPRAYKCPIIPQADEWELCKAFPWFICAGQGREPVICTARFLRRSCVSSWYCRESAPNPYNTIWEWVCLCSNNRAYCLSQNCKKRHAKFGNDSKIVWFVKKSVDFFWWRLYVKNMLRKEDAAILVVYFSQ